MAITDVPATMAHGVVKLKINEIINPVITVPSLLLFRFVIVQMRKSTISPALTAIRLLNMPMMVLDPIDAIIK